MSSRANSASLIPQSLEARPKQSPNMLHPGSRTGSRLSNYGVRAVATPSSAASRSRKSSPPQTVNHRDYTKKLMSRSVSNPCLYDYNMKSNGAPSFVRNQLTFTGGVASFIGEPLVHPLAASQNQEMDFLYRNGSQSARPLNMGDLLQRNPNSGGFGLEDDAQKVKFRPATSESASRMKLGNAGKASLAGYSNEALNHLSQKLNSARVSARKPSACQNGRPLNEKFLKRSKTTLDSKIERRTTEENVTEQLMEILRSVQPHEDPKLEIKDLVKDAVREYFDALNLPQMIETHRELTNEAAVPQQQYPGYGGFTDEEQVWAVVHKDPLSEIMNSTQPRPTSRQLVTPAQGLTRSKTQYWKDESEFQTKLEDWASTASQHEQEIVKNLLTKLNGGVAPEVKARPINENSKPKNRLRRSYSGAVGAGKKVIPAQYQCDLSMFTKPPYNPQRHFTINPEWTSERYTVKKIPAAHLHPSASLKNKLGLLRS